MSESQSNACVATALIDVRKAYRLLWLYQQTLMDVYNQIVQHLNVQHYAADLDPLLRSTNPAQKPPQALLPLLRIDTLYLHSNGPTSQQQPDDYLVDILHIADTGFNPDERNGRYTTDAGSVNDARSELRIYVYHARAESSVNWYWEIWMRTDYPAHDTKRTSEALSTIQVYGYHFDVATLIDQQTIAAQMAHFKGRVKAELGLQL